MADVRNPNPHVTISIVGSDSAGLRDPAQVLEGFAIKLVDPQGQPLPDLIVDFFVNVSFQGLPRPDAPPPPPAGLYGAFAAPNGWVQATTDAEGIARSGPFIGGTAPGTYQVAAAVYFSFYPENAVLVGPPGPTAYFEVNQIFGSAIGLPIGSPISLAALAILMLCVASRHAKRFLN